QRRSRSLGCALLGPAATRAGPALSGPVEKVQREACPRPGDGDEPAAVRERDVGRAKPRTAEADVGRGAVGHRPDLDQSAIGRDYGDAAVHEGRDADVAVGLDREAVVALIAAAGGIDQAAAVRAGPGLALDLAGSRDVEGPNSRAFGLGDVQCALV